MTIASAIEQDLKSRLAAAETALKAKAEALISAHKAWAIACAVCLVAGIFLGKHL